MRFALKKTMTFISTTNMHRNETFNSNIITCEGTVSQCQTDCIPILNGHELYLVHTALHSR